ncbi:hypothetical protein HK102_006808, partial [Quaeritorhiza haematococci]
MKKAAIFNLYVLSYEFVLAYKAKPIIGNRRVISTITTTRTSNRRPSTSRSTPFSLTTLTWANLLFTLSVLTRIIIGLGTLLTTEVVPTSSNAGTCINKYNETWIKTSNFSRNILEVVWSLLFVIPIYRVMASATHQSFYARINAMPYSNIFIANCLYPLVANFIAVGISIWMAVDAETSKSLGPWVTLLFGIQNFVSSYSVNLILDIRVDSDDSSSTAPPNSNASYGAGGYAYGATGLGSRGASL